MSKAATGKGAKPLTKARSNWHKLPPKRMQGPDGLTEIICEAWVRNVHDGHLLALISDEPVTGLHLSISHRTNTTPTRSVRYPQWDEIIDARERLLPGDVGFVMHLPPLDQYVALHDTTFHLHEDKP